MPMPTLHIPKKTPIGFPYRLFLCVHSFCRNFWLEFSGGGCESLVYGKGRGHRGSGMVPSESALVSSYRSSPCSSGNTSMAFGLRWAKMLGWLSVQLVSKISNLRDPDPSRLQTDGETDCMKLQDRALHYSASCGKNSRRSSNSDDDNCGLDILCRALRVALNIKRTLWFMMFSRTLTENCTAVIFLCDEYRWDEFMPLLFCFL